MPTFLDPRLWATQLDRMVVLMLVLTRVSGLFAALPGLGQERIPTVVRAGLALMVSMIIAPVVPKPSVLPDSMVLLLEWMLLELATGLLLGLLVGWIVEAVAFGGWLMDTQMGFGFAQMYDPVSAQPASVAGTLLLQSTMLFLLVSGLHHQMIVALVETYRLVPVGQGLPLRGQELVMALGQMLVRGFQLSFPVLITLFFVDVLEGIASKLMPQLQLIQISFPIKIMVGLVVFGYVLREFSAWLVPLLQRAPVEALRLVG